MASVYRNPVLPGFHPDPSTVRVGEDYYLVNSTFHYFPGITISHSRDLVHWRAIGHAFTRSDWLDFRGLLDSRGFWAPDISYHDGLFYIFVTLRLNETNPDGSPASLIRRQMVVTSVRPEGPYSRPRFIDVNGIDPSHFVDDDGRHYMVLNPGATLVPLNDDCSAAMGEPVKIWDGSGGRIPEGPHLFKKDGWYHLVTAEGGTGYGHRIASGRSKNLYGPYESNPHNPLLTQRYPSAMIQRTGHGKFVETQAGEWWVLYLCGRPFWVEETGLEEHRFCILGRETCLDSVTWTENGWPLVNGGQGPSEEREAPKLAFSPVSEETGCDDFDSPELGLCWYTPRNPDVLAMSLTERPGFLRLHTRGYDLDRLEARPVLRREVFFKSEARCKMSFQPRSEGEEAGLTAYYDTKTHIKFCRVHAGSSFVLRLQENRGASRRTLAEAVEGRSKTAPILVEDRAETPKSVLAPDLFLRMVTDGLRREFFYSYGGRDWTKLGAVDDAWYLSDEGYSVPGHKRFTGSMVGVYAFNGGTASTSPADFDWFEYRELR